MHFKEEKMTLSYIVQLEQKVEEDFKRKERVNVAFSRAKILLIICGDMDFFYKFDDPDNKFVEIIDYIHEHEDECLIISGGEL